MMKILKYVSDELWLGIVCLIVAVWLFAINTNFLIISGIFVFVGIVLLIVDNLKKHNNIKVKTESKKEK